MASKVLNIEVGESITKVCCALPGKKSCRVTESFMLRTPNDSVLDGAINEPELLADKLVRELEERKLRGVKSVVFSIASGKIASREIKLPYMKDKALKEAVQTNAGDYFPVDISRYHITYLLLERVKGAEGFSRVLVLAAPLSLLEGYFKLAELAKLDIKAIDSCSNSHYQLIRKLNDPLVSMYVEVDCSASFVSFLQGGELLLQRTFAFGGGELVSGYMSDTDKKEEEFAEALAELCDNSPDFVGEDKVDEATVKDGLSRLVYNIVRSVDYFNSFRWEAATAQIVLTGPCGHLVGIKQAVAEATDLPTVYLEELAGAEELCPGTDISSYISCIGSNLAPVDFMPEYLLKRKIGLKRANQEATLLKGALACGALVLAAAAFAGVNIYDYNIARQQLNAAKAEIASLEPAEQTFLTYEAYKQGEEALLQIRSLEQSPNAQLVSFFEELEEKMPSEILILSAVCTPEGVSMNITVPGLEEAAVVLSQLRSFDSLGSVEVSGIVTQNEEGGSSTASFSLDCTYGVNPYLNNINPYGDIFTPDTAEGTAEDAAADGEAEAAE